MRIRAFRAAAAALVLAAAAGAGAFLLPAPAEAQRVARNAQAEAFVQAQASRAVAILANRSLSVGQKQVQFRTFVDQTVDVPRISLFVLGRYARGLKPAQRAQFETLFREYASNLYEARLGDYRGEQVRVTGSTARSANDVVVSSVISGGQLRQPEAVRWRLARAGSSWRVIDIEVRGVWLAVVQQQDYVSTLDAARGDINVLMNQLRQEVARQNRRS
jgi:phospholipid transport system substrate-binding protein